MGSTLVTLGQLFTVIEGFLTKCAKSVFLMSLGVFWFDFFENRKLIPKGPSHCAPTKNEPGFGTHWPDHLRHHIPQPLNHMVYGCSLAPRKYEDTTWQFYDTPAVLVTTKFPRYSNIGSPTNMQWTIEFWYYFWPPNMQKPLNCLYKIFSNYITID